MIYFSLEYANFMVYLKCNAFATKRVGDKIGIDTFRGKIGTIIS